MLINKYDPRLKKLDELEQTFACGEKILDELAAELKPGKDKQLSRQSWIITGARGAGKSHLLTLLYHRIKKDELLSRYWQPVIFPEELFGVDSIYRLLLQVFDHIFKGDGASPTPREIRDKFTEIKKARIIGSLKEKKQTGHMLAKQLFELLAELKSITGKSFILMLENLQYLLREQLSADDARHLRGFMSENPDVFIIIGTALTVFDEISDYGKPFYHFFRIRSMDNLGRQEIMDFLLKLAAFRKDEGIDERIVENRRYIYLYQLLTGGNPRLILFLYELLLGNEKLDTYMILEKITELTPYFLDKTRDESGQRKLILDTLATEAPAQTAKEIAHYINEDYKSIVEQLKRLATEGWIREIALTAENTRKNEVFYTLRDYFYRIWYKMRTRGIEESDVLCMAELAVFLFDRGEIEERLKKYANSNEDIRQLYEKALELSATEPFMKNIVILLEEAKKFENKEVKEIITEWLNYFLNSDYEKAIKCAGKLLYYPDWKYFGYGLIGMGNYDLNNYDESYSALSRYIRYRPFFILDPESFSAPHMFNLFKKVALEIFTSSIELQKLFDNNSAISIKFESLCRLFLLGKFPAVANTIDQLLEEPGLPKEEINKLDYLLEEGILDMLKEHPQDAELKVFIKYWLRIIAKMKDAQVIRKKLLQFISLYIRTVAKENISLELVENIFRQLYDEGIEISDIILKIIAAVKNPNSREAQQWMADPLFSQIVHFFSGGDNCGQPKKSQN
jgi:hypothetical protein